MATWDIRSRKRLFEPSLPASFSLSGGTRLSIQVGNRSRSPEKTQVYGQLIMREGMHRLQECLPKTALDTMLPAGWSSTTSWTLAHIVSLQATSR